MLFYLPLLDTTDVQESHIFVNPSQYSLVVNCSFVAGSRARGCVFELNGMYVHISREQGSYEHRASGPLGEFTHAVYDWEENGTVGSVPALLHVSYAPTDSGALTTRSHTGVGKLERGCGREGGDS